MQNNKIIKKYMSIYFLILMILPLSNILNKTDFLDVCYLLVVFYELFRMQFIKD